MTSPDPLAHLLGELDAAAQAEADRLRRDDAGYRARLEALEPVVAALRGLPPDAWEPPEPPPLRHPQAAPPAAAPAPAPRATTPWWRRFTVPLPAFAAATAVALAVGVALGSLLGGDGSSPAPERVVADVRLAAFGDAPSGAGGDARVLADRQVALQVHDLAPSAGAAYYTVWLLNADGRMVALGSFRVPASGAVTVRMPLPVDAARFDFVDVSAEPDDGDPAHSGHSVLRGPTA